ncbi:CDP-diacylglycerol--glycerol-3-phosphate 3-phosphatidyltransferase [Halobacteroides halobius]|nr:CDP-diacylglycerol--glycerol-3-phosphate 3-phosphatidyltransferase [Halobacteroides halobius]
MTVANCLTLIRILLLPFFLFFFFYDFSNHYLIAAIIFTLSALTDLFDGYIARKFDQITSLGKILDPLADKLTFIIVFTALAIDGFIPFILIVFILVRELVVLCGSMYMYYRSKDIISPSNTGKGATFLLYITAVSYIWDLSFLQPAAFIAIGLALLSGVRYCIEGYNKYFVGHNIKK